MKKKIITIMIASIMAGAFVGCGAKGEEKNIDNNATNVNVQESNKEEGKETSDSSTKTVKVTEDELKKINAGNIERLKAFYKSNGLPCYTDNLYNSSVDEARIYFSTGDAEVHNIDTKGMVLGEYQYLNTFSIQASINLVNDDDLDLNNSLAVGYCEAIVNEKIDFSDIMKDLKEYKDNFTERSEKFSKAIETENYTVTVVLTPLDLSKVGVNIISKYEVK